MLSLLVSALSAWAQGKLILGNDSAHLFVLGTTLPADAGLGGGDTTVGNTTGAIPMSPLPSGVTLAVALYVGTTSGNLALQTAIPLTATGWLSPGRMRDFDVILALPGGAPRFCDIVVYDFAFPPSPISPTPGSSYFGESGAFPVSGSPGPSGYRLVDYWLDGNLVINVPEPSVLAICGLAWILIFTPRRRKALSRLQWQGARI